MPNCFGIWLLKAWRKKTGETYDDDERSKQCIDDMYGRNLELGKSKYEYPISLKTHWIEEHESIGLLDPTAGCDDVASMGLRFYIKPRKISARGVSMF